MDFGVRLPAYGSQATRTPLTDLAQAADALEFSSCWVSDHLVIPHVVESRYPSRPVGAPVPPALQPGVPWLDCLALLCFLAGCTERIRLGTSVMVLGYRPPLLTAKQLATLDVLSGGRVILGVGVGWMREEFEALGMPADRRGARADETLEIFRTVFAEEAPAFAGRFSRFSSLSFAPKPIQDPIPVWVGGSTRAAFRRAVRYGDAFHAAFAPPATAAEHWAAVRREAEAAGRDPASLGFSVCTSLVFDGPPRKDGDLAGSTAAVIAEIRRWETLGVTQLTLDVAAQGSGVAGQISAMDRFSREVLPEIP